MKSWRTLGVVETIYEEDSDQYSTSSSSSPSLDHCTDLSSPSTALHCRVEEWSLATERKPDVFVHVRGTSFHLHKDPLSKRSAYLRLHITDVSELTLSPPLNITAETFSLVADFCYGAHVALTPYNVASLRIAAELLLMTEADAADGEENLKQITESYFRRAVAVNREYAAVVLRSSLALLPESETNALLVGRCVEALDLTEDGDGIEGFIEEVVALPPEDFGIFTEAVHLRFSRHNLLYRIVDIYIEEQDSKITGDQKVEICNSIDCAKLSPQSLLHAVQNPKMPLRFIVRAMLAEQLNTRRSILSSARHRETNTTARSSSVTLGSILRRDSAARQAAQLRAAMDATSSRIESLERELDAMRKLLSRESERKISISERVGSRSVLDSGRSASFHCVVPRSDGGKIGRGERGSVSSLSLRFGRGGEGGGRAVVLSSSSAGSSGESPKVIKRNSNIRQKVMKGLKSAFWVTKQSSKKTTVMGNDSGETGREAYEDYDGYEDFVWIKEEDGDYLPSFQEKNASLSLI